MKSMQKEHAELLAFYDGLECKGYKYHLAVYHDATEGTERTECCLTRRKQTQSIIIVATYDFLKKQPFHYWSDQQIKQTINRILAAPLGTPE